MAYFKNVTSFEDLKAQFRTLARQHHPDAGGDPEVMKAINTEYDKLFPIWKQRCNTKGTETADSTRREFYTANGWKGENYDPHRSLKEISALVRAYVKDKYPMYKFSVTKNNYSSLVIILKESYKDIFTPTARRDDYLGRTINFTRDALTAEAKAMFEDIQAFVNSYNREDIDAQVDYFDVCFWFTGVRIAYEYKVNPALAAKATKTTGNKAKRSKVAASTAPATGHERYDIRKTTHTKTGETIWVVKLLQNLSRDEYLAEASKMKARGGYYSRFVHGFVFKADPTESLVA